MPKQQVKSKSRVAAHGEVFTAEWEVKAMCDLVQEETERIESRFLEPAYGNGNFLAEVLSRKLAVVKRRYGKSPFDYQRYSVQAVMSLYGVELLPDNATEYRERLLFCGMGVYRRRKGSNGEILSEGSAVPGEKYPLRGPFYQNLSRQSIFFCGTVLKKFLRRGVKRIEE